MIQFSTCKDNNAWNQFLEKEKDNQMITIAHNPSLGPILSKTFGYTSENNFIMKNEKVVGVFPAVVFRNKLISMPHFSYGGPITTSHETVEFDLNTINHGKKFEIRSFSKLSEHYAGEKMTFVLELNKSIDDQFKGLKARVRNKIRKTTKMDFKVVHGKQELLNDFYAIYSRRMLQKGSPPLGKLFFQNILEDYQYGEVEITIVYDDKKPVATVFCLSYLNFNEICWASSDLSYNKYNVNSLLYWKVIASSISKKYRYFSMGRSTVNSNNHHYKTRWDPIELPVFYNYSEPMGRSVKELTFLTKIWKIQPLRTSVYFGHKISKYIY